MMVQNRRGIVLLAGILLLGCSQVPPGGPRAKTYPVTGIVQVDGEPTAGVDVTFNPQGDTSVLKRPGLATSVAGGKFAAFTYVANDGLPDGTYKLGFVLDDNKFVARADVKDRLKDAYVDPTTSKFEVTVKGAKVDLGVIELSTKPPAK